MDLQSQNNDTTPDDVAIDVAAQPPAGVDVDLETSIETSTKTSTDGQPEATNPPTNDPPATGLKPARAGLTHSGGFTNSGPEFMDFKGRVVNEAPAAFYSTDLDGIVLSWNSAAEALYGWSAEEAIGNFVPMIAPEEMAHLVEIYPGLLTGESAPGMEVAVVHRDGHHMRVKVSITPILDDRGAPRGVHCIAIDITDNHETSMRLAAAEYRWRSLLEKTSDTVTIIDDKGNVVSSTKDFDYDFTPGQISWNRLGADLTVADEGQAQIFDALDRLMANPGEPVTEVLRVVGEDGYYEFVELTAVNHLEDPSIRGIVVTSRYITEITLAHELLEDEAAVLEMIAQGAPVHDVLERIIELIEYHTGGTAACFPVTVGTGEEFKPVTRPTLMEAINNAIAADVGGPCAMAAQSRQPVIVEEIDGSPLFGAAGAGFIDAGYHAAWSHPITATESDDVLGTIAIYYRTSRAPTEREMAVVSTAVHLSAIAIERDRVHSRLAFQANHDPLTRLPNRAAIQDHLEAALAKSVDSDPRVAVLIIDLDRFKVINDSLGHSAGDTLLVGFGDRLRQIVGGADFVGHFGSDEFVVVIEDIDEVEDIRRVTSRLDLALGEPFAVGDQEIFLSTSIGVALSSGPDETANRLLQNADVAMSRSKVRGRDRIEIFDREMRIEVDDRLRLDRELRVAVERAELKLHYQPKIDVATQKIMGVEALLRWDHPDEGMVLPGRFITVAEETGLIVRIGTWVIEEAIRQARHWVDKYGVSTDFVVAVNLSARQLSSPGLTAHVAKVLKRYDWPADNLILEITESVLMDDTDTTLMILQQLKGLGLRLAIDDFGTGFSSLSYLERFPVDILKVDRAFIARLNAQGEGSPVATAVVHLARALGLKTAAEGIEHPWQLSGVRSLGCDIAQGFLFAKALPAEELANFIDKDETKPTAE